MRLGGPLFTKWDSPESWIQAVKASGYKAAFCPVDGGANFATVQAYAKAAREADIIIAEVGTWSNPLSNDPKTRQEAITQCKAGLLIAEKIEARCAVNISGSRGAKWDGPDPRDLTGETFDLIVQSVRDIIDSVKPRKTYYTLETMPWMYPDSVESYLRLIKAVDRKAFAVHFDPVNLICSPQRYFENGALIREFCTQLGPYIRSCHAKDIMLGDKLTVHLDEVRPGMGTLDYQTFLREINRLDRDMSIMLEHLPNEGEYRLAADHIRAIAKKEDIIL